MQRWMQILSHYIRDVSAKRGRTPRVIAKLFGTMCVNSRTSQVLEAWLCHPGREALLMNGLIQGIRAF